MDHRGSRSREGVGVRSNRLWIGLVVALLVGSSVAAIPGAVSAQQATQSVVGEPDITFSTASGSVTAGTASELAVSITNRGEVYRTGPPGYEDQVTTARAMTLRFKDGNVPIDVKSGEVAAGSVPIGSTSQTVPITVAENTDPGTYKIPIEYEYLYTRAVEYNANGVVDRTEYTRTKTGSITVRVEEDARFEVIETNGTAQVGDTSDVSVTLENTGTQTAHSATVVASSQSGAMRFDAGSPNASAYIGEWAPDETRTVTYDVGLAPEASVREYTVGLTVNYEDSDGIPQQSGSLTAGIDTLPEQSFALSNVESTLRVGQDGQICGTVRNDGPDPVRNVKLTLGESAFVPRSGSYAVGDLDIGETATFQFTVAVPRSADPVPQQIDVTTTYRTDEDNRDRSMTDPIQVEIAERRDALTARAIDARFAAGESGELGVEVTNQRDVELRDVQVNLTLTEPLDSDFRTTVIPSLGAGETSTVTFDLEVDGGAPASQFPATVGIEYVGPDGDRETARPSTITVTVTEAGGEDLSIELVVLAVLVVLVAVGAWWFYGH
ncbi:COG1361 S-layer family protein [Halorhabdus amylolytica]|uniref:COG1361 S-layer family protein n=1 Tax=Halorhabdus amylolytica TaxID=2559573 RepID=UPI0010AA1F3D|nr:COG1361 S-layer family protein [Halorhabdus amylolytica]